MAVAAQRGWTLHSMDVEKAFLQGQSYAELAEETGEELRQVNFRLPLRCIASIRQLHGYGDFNPMMEVLHFIKPGVGFATRLALSVASSRSAPPPSVARHSGSTTRWSATTRADASSLSSRSMWMASRLRVKLQS